MRLIMPLFLALLGAGVGILVCRLFVRSWLAYPAAATIGAFSAFAGMILRDAFDLTLITSDTLFDMLFAAIITSLIVSVVVNIVTSIIAQRDKQ